VTVRLHGYFRSSASWRVRIALAYKGIPYEYAAVNLVRDGGEQYSDAYRAINPLQAVPTLEIDGHRLSESLAILHYLEETRPSPPLLPAESYARAQVRRIAEAINAGIQPLQNLRVLVKLDAEFHAGDAGRKAWAAHFNEVGLRSLERLVQASAGRCCVGDEVSMADLCLVPQLYGARRFGVDVAAFPTLLRVEAELMRLSAFADAVPSKQPDCPPGQA
jgi:maleylpyruvate isomerase